MAVLQKETTPSASIVIPTYQRGMLALTLAKQIRQFDKKIEIIIVDQENGRPLLPTETDKLDVRYFNLASANTSVAKNMGIREAKGDIIIFFDDDVEITRQTIGAHLGAYRDKGVIGVSGRVIIDGEKIPPQTAVDTGKTNLLGTKFLYRFWSTKEQTIDFVYGCNMSFRKSILKKIGGFDEKFPKIFEEVDLSKRAKKYGRILFLPEAIAYHHKAKSGGIRPEERLNKQKLIFRHYGYYLAKDIVFPLSLIALLLRLRTAVKTSRQTVFTLLTGYCQSLLLNYRTILIFLPIAFVRLWRVPDFFLFTFSEEWQGTLAWDLVKHFHRIWIGVSQANINYYLGPGFIYLNYLLFLIGRGNPAVLAYFSAILGLITVICLYFITKELFSRPVAIMAAIFYGCSTLINYYDRRFWNPTPIPFITVWYVYSLIKARENTRWYILTAILTGAIFHTHLSLLLLLIPATYSLISNLKKIKLSTWLLMISCYLVITSPLIVFDFVHNFDNFLMPVKIIFHQGKNSLYPVSITNMLSHVNLLISMFGRLWFTALHTNLQNIALETHTTNIPGNIFLAMLSIIALIWFFWKNRRPGYPVFFIFMAAMLLAYIVYPSYNPEYYLMGFITLMTIAIGFLLNSLPKALSYPILTVFVIANILTVVTATGDYGLTMKQHFIQKSMTVIKNREFSLETAGPLENPQYAYAGWRLLFKLYGKTPTKSSVDSVLGWIYPDEIAKNEPPLHLVVAEQPMTFKQPAIAQFKEGVYWGYVFKN